MWEKFNLIIPVQIRWVDLDAFQHINNAVYLSYMELARVHYWVEVIGKTRIEDINFIIAEIDIKYKAPATLGDRLAVGIRADELKTHSFKFFYEFRETSKGLLAAEAMSVQVVYDYKAQKTVELPDDLRRPMEAFEAAGRKVFAGVPGAGS